MAITEEMMAEKSGEYQSGILNYVNRMPPALKQSLLKNMDNPNVSEVLLQDVQKMQSDKSSTKFTGDEKALTDAIKDKVEDMDFKERAMLVISLAEFEKKTGFNAHQAQKEQQAQNAGNTSQTGSVDEFLRKTAYGPNQSPIERGASSPVNQTLDSNQIQEKSALYQKAIFKEVDHMPATLKESLLRNIDNPKLSDVLTQDVKNTLDDKKSVRFNGDERALTETIKSKVEEMSFKEKAMLVINLDAFNKGLDPNAKLGQQIEAEKIEAARTVELSKQKLEMIQKQKDAVTDLNSYASKVLPQSTLSTAEENTAMDRVAKMSDSQRRSLLLDVEKDIEKSKAYASADKSEALQKYPDLAPAYAAREAFSQKLAGVVDNKDVPKYMGDFDKSMSATIANGDIGKVREAVQYQSKASQNNHIETELA